MSGSLFAHIWALKCKKPHNPKPLEGSGLSGVAQLFPTLGAAHLGLIALALDKRCQCRAAASNNSL
jgi:hypothetical protein